MRIEFWRDERMKNNVTISNITLFFKNYLIGIDRCCAMVLGLWPKKEVKDCCEKRSCEMSGVWDSKNHEQPWQNYGVTLSQRVDDKIIVTWRLFCGKFSHLCSTLRAKITRCSHYCLLYWSELWHQFVRLDDRASAMSALSLIVRPPRPLLSGQILLISLSTAFL